MAANWETSARKLVHEEVDVINYSDVHPHDPKKIIAFSAAGAASAPAAAPCRVRGAQRMARRRKLLTAYARYACVILLMLFLYLRIAVFPEGGNDTLHLLWIGAYALAGLSVLIAKTNLFMHRR